MGLNELNVKKCQPSLPRVFEIHVRTNDIYALYNCVCPQCALLTDTYSASFSDNVDIAIPWSSSDAAPYVCVNVAHS